MSRQGMLCFKCKDPYYGPGPVCPKCLTATMSTATCIICKTIYVGVGAICTNCRQTAPPPKPHCTFCGGLHNISACKAFWNMALGTMQSTSATAQMRKTNRHYTNYAQRTPPLKACRNCKGNYLIESKAGSVCSSCHTVVHHPCRNCESTNTKGLAAPNENLVPGLGTIQFIECQDCLFIE